MRVRGSGIGVVTGVVAGLVVAAGVAAGAAALRNPAVIEVAPGTAMSDLIAAAGDGSAFRLLPGTHAPFDVVRSVSIEAAAGAVVQGPILVLADDVRLTDVSVDGGPTGILVREADDAVLERVRVTGTELHGIEITFASATITDCTIAGMISPAAQGIEIRMSSGRPRTVVRGCHVSGGQEGIVTHVSHVEFLDNVVTGTSLRGVVVTEVSEGWAEGNLVHDVTGTAIYCGDGAHCEFRGNTIRDVGPVPGLGPGQAGWAFQAMYKATMRVEDNEVTGAAAGEVRTSMNGSVVPWFPLVAWPMGLTGLWPGPAFATLVAALLLIAVVTIIRPIVRRARAGAQAMPPPRSRRRHGDIVLGVVAAGLGVYAFHMLEHVVQVWQIYVIDVEFRAGLLGRAVNKEWLHFSLNASVLVYAWWLTIGVWRGAWGRAAILGAPGLFLPAATAIQSYHFVEHVAKITQHLDVALDPAPGLLGGRSGLVLFHFALNLATFTGLAIGAIALLRRARLDADRAVAETTGEPTLAPIGA